MTLLMQSVNVDMLYKDQGEMSDLIDEEIETELVPAVPSLPLATLLYSSSNVLAAEMAEVSPLSAAIARHMGINLTPDGIAARNRRGIAVIVHGAPLSGIHNSQLFTDLDMMAAGSVAWFCMLYLSHRCNHCM